MYLRVVGAIAIISLLMVSCRTQRVATDIDEHIRWHDSTRVQVVNVYDTTHVIDTVRIEVFEQSSSREHTDVQFGAGGGTYNTRTGEATNVIGVNTSSETDELKRTNAELTHELKSVKSSNDSLQSVVGNLESELSQQQSVEKSRSWWDTFTTWWFIACVVYILARVALWAFRTFYLHR